MLDRRIVASIKSRIAPVLAAILWSGTAYGQVVKAVVDGDTIHLTTGERVRLIGVDAPERGQPFYNEAKYCLVDLVQGKRVQTEYDMETTDVHGRRLGYVFVGRTFVNGAMVRAGMAYASSHPPNTRYDGLLASVQREARASRRGIWSLRKPSDERSYVGNTGTRKFHRPSCEWAPKIEPKNLVRLRTRDQALDLDLTPCRSCDP